MPDVKKGAAHTNQIHRLNRIEGQVRGLRKMIEDQRYCLDILTQIKAVKSAIGAVEQKILEQHIDHCVHKAVYSNDERIKKELLDEIKHLLKKTCKQ